jgi:putative addiction module component (TIGR02574 family)
MTTQSADAILTAALGLPPENRAVLAEKLLESLENEGDGDIKAAWAEEAERRVRALKEGALKTIPGDEVLRSLQLGKD